MNCFKVFVNCVIACEQRVNYVPGVGRVRCWNHTINAVKLWLRRYEANSAEIPVYVSNLRELFHQPSEEVYRNISASL